MKHWKQLLAILILCLSTNGHAQQKDQPKLIVGIVVDQMCYEYLYRFQEKYGKNGIRLLMDKGTNCRNTNYNYVPTKTEHGHA